MISTRYKARWRGDDELDAEMAARKLIRDYLTDHYPDIPRPPGGRWMFTPIAFPCPYEHGFLIRVRVPHTHLPTLAYCPACKRVFEELVAG